MKTFFKNFWHSFWDDEQAFRNRVHGLVGALAASGAAYADQLAALGLPPHAAGYIRVAAVLAAFALSVHNSP